MPDLHARLDVAEEIIDRLLEGWEPTPVDRPTYWRRDGIEEDMTLAEEAYLGAWARCRESVL